jgi:acyl-CoA synthetase (AMP-forming)/AMP-acid ligase II
VLRRCDKVLDAVVVALPGHRDELELHAAVTGTVAGAGRLEDVVRAQLPDYMRPRSYTWIPEFPLNPNGKVDRARVLSVISGTAGESDGSPR